MMPRLQVHGRIPQRPLVAQRRQPMREAQSEQPTVQSGYAQQGYGLPPAYGRWAYGPYGRPAYAQQQPAPFSYYGARVYDGGQLYYQPYDAY